MHEDVDDAEVTAKVELLTLGQCGACRAARAELRRRGIAFEELNIQQESDAWGLLVERTGVPRAPQIMIDGEPIGGGAGALARLDRRGVLAARLHRRAFPLALIRRRFSLLHLLWSALAAVSGGGCGPWRYTVELVDKHGRRLERVPAGSGASAQAIAESLNAPAGHDG